MTTNRKPKQNTWLVKVLVSSMILGGATLAGPGAANAAPNEPFVPDVGTILLTATNSNWSQLQLNYGENLPSGFQWNALGPLRTTPPIYTGIGYHEPTGFVFGMRSSLSVNPNAGEVIKIDSEGNATSTGYIPDFPRNGVSTAFGGAFGSGEHRNTYVGFWVAGSAVYAVQVVFNDAGQPISSKYELLQAGNFADLTYKDGYFWFLDSNNFYRVNPETLLQESFPRPAGFAPSVQMSSGGAWTYSNGNVGFVYASVGTGSGRAAVQLKITGANTSAPVFEEVGRYIYPGSSGASDATFVPATPPPDIDYELSIAGPASAVIGDQVDFEFTVENLDNGLTTGISGGGVMQVELSSEISDVVLPQGCLQESLVISCFVPVLDIGGKTTFPVSGIFTGNPRTVVLSATATPDEFDPDASNNSGTFSTLLVDASGSVNAAASASASADADAMGNSAAQAAAVAAAMADASTQASAAADVSANAAAQAAAQAAANSVADSDTNAGASAAADVDANAAAQSAAIADATADSSAGASGNVNAAASASASADADASGAVAAQAAAVAAAMADASTQASAAADVSANAAAQAAGNVAADASTDASGTSQGAASAAAQAAANSVADSDTNAGASAAADVDANAAAQSAAIADATADSSAGASGNVNAAASASASADADASGAKDASAIQGDGELEKTGAEFSSATLWASMIVMIIAGSLLLLVRREKQIH